MMGLDGGLGGGARRRGAMGVVDGVRQRCAGAAWCHLDPGAARIPDLDAGVEHAHVAPKRVVERDERRHLRSAPVVDVQGAVNISVRDGREGISIFAEDRLV